eukprot:maker-scaffold10_size831480-snap-gene-3.16 protein:Tk01817 transcript:maker-scaffold10_size831480-snap-gene-3.16-mRNA-1 annotation:"cytochrome b5 reductase 4 isoform x3"
MDYHPGGWDELVRGAGIDATDLFNEVHRWVNYESMLSSCVVGKLVDESESSFRIPSRKGIAAKANSTAKEPSSPLNGKSVIPPIRPKSQLPSMDTHQTDSTFVISIFTRLPKRLQRENVIVEIRDLLHLYLAIQMPPGTSEGGHTMIYTCEYVLSAEARIGQIKVASNTGKVEVVLQKEANKSWPNLGQPGENTPKMSKAQDVDTKYRDWKLLERKPVADDMDHLTLEPASGQDLHFYVP